VLRYDLALDVDFDAAAFRGELAISGWTPEEPFELDAVDLEIAAVDQGGTSLRFRSDTDRGKLVLSGPIRPEIPIRIAYSGRAATDVQVGLFITRLGTEKALSTQMEPLGCRRLIPCFDRPDRKAVLRLTVTTAAEPHVIANSAGRSERLPDGRRKWTFDPTPPISTYLVYLGIGPFEEARDASEPPEIIVAGPPGSRARAARTLGVARRAVRALSEYYDLPYPLPKLHFVALTDFWVGMENWGAISGAEDHYLLDESASPNALRFADQTIVHEAAHQWFGDLVTLQTWEDLWLNEAFATFVWPRIVERARIRQDAWGEFVLFTARGDPTDSLESTHPVKPDSVDAAEIMASADNITYFKGSRLIRMVEAFVGEEGFRRGISAYLKRHQFGNARSVDLWKALDEHSGHDLVAVMRPWVERAGLPCVSVAQEGPNVVLTQRRFTYRARPAPEPPWPIPLPIEHAGVRTNLLFDTERHTLPDCDARRLRLDPGRAGFFRILLAPELRAAAIAELPTMAPLDRWGFLHDARAFVLSGDYELAEYLGLLRAIASVDDGITVEEVTQTLQTLGPVLSDVPEFVEAARTYLAAQSERLGETPTPGERQERPAMREAVSWRRVLVDDEYARAMSSRFDRVDTEPVAVRRAIQVACARSGTPEFVDRFYERATGADSDAAGQVCFAAEGLPDDATMRALLDRCLASIKLGDLFSPLLISAGRNPRARAAFWTWLSENLRELERRAQGSYLLAYSLEIILPCFGIGREREVREFFERDKFPEGAVGIRAGLEMLEATARLRERLGLGRAGA
jgi:tricorn protease interacting factor F2/3